MRNYCLSVDEINKILKWREYNEPIGSKNLVLEIEEAKSWTTKIICIVLFFARILEREQTSVEKLKQKINAIFSLSDDFWFEMQETNEDFIEYLLQHLKNKNDSLEDALIEIQNGLSEFDYEKAIRH